MKQFEVWYGDPDKDHGSATLEGGDVMPIGNGTVLIGMGERSSHQAIGQVARTLFAKGAADKVVVAGLGHIGARPCTWTPCSASATAT